MLKIAWNKYFNHPLPVGHRFPMIKYDLIPEQLIYEGAIKEENLFAPGLLPEEMVLLAHTAGYWKKLSGGLLTKGEIRRTGFPYSKSLVDRERYIVEGTVKCAQYALQYGVAMNIAGGTHHAYSYKGGGFCLLNDTAIAAAYLLEKKLAKKILIIDLDVHQGDGTAEIFAANADVFTFSMHGENNFPLKKQKSDLDIPLQDGADDRAYLSLLKYHLPAVVDHFHPDFVFFQAGVDVLKSDKLGRLSLTMQGCKERDRFVLELCKRNNIPIMTNMGGGYSEKISDIVEAHANVYRIAQDLFF